MLKTTVRNRGAITTAVIVLFALGATTMVRDVAAKGVKAAANDRGQIVVTEEATGKVLHAIAKPPGLVREIIALQGGAVVATTKQNVTEFWNAANGTLVRRLDERAYVFNSGRTLFVTYTPQHDLLLRNYPDLSIKYVLATKQGAGPSAFRFSPNERYLAVEYCNHYPLSDEAFLNPVFDKTRYWVTVFDLSNGRQLPEVGGGGLGTFSADSRFYTSEDGHRLDLSRAVPTR